MLNIFNPNRVFKNVFQSSWCQNITHCDEHIPIIKTDDPPSLSLEATPESEYFIGALPILRSWQPTDLTSYKKLKFNITATNTDYPSVAISLTSFDKIEKDSTLIDLIHYGLMEDCEQEFTIALNEFVKNSNFDLTIVKMIKFIGYGCFNMKLSKIYIE